MQKLDQAINFVSRLLSEKSDRDRKVLRLEVAWNQFACWRRHMLHGSALQLRQDVTTGIADDLGAAAVQMLGMIAFDQIGCQAVILGTPEGGGYKGVADHQ